MKLSSILTATAAAIVSMAEPTSAQDKNLRALRPDPGYGHASKIGCGVTLKMMGTLGLAGGKWDKFLSKMCPGMSWSSHLATKGVCAAAPPSASCGALTVGQSVHRASCWSNPSSNPLKLTAFRMSVALMEESGSLQSLSEQILVSVHRSIVVGDTLATLQPVMSQKVPIYFEGWNTVWLKEAIQVPGYSEICLNVAIPNEMFIIGNELTSAVAFENSFWSSESNFCPVGSDSFAILSGANWCMEAFMGH